MNSGHNPPPIRIGAGVGECDSLPCGDEGTTTLRLNDEKMAP